MRLRQPPIGSSITAAASGLPRLCPLVLRDDLRQPRVRVEHADHRPLRHPFGDSTARLRSKDGRPRRRRARPDRPAPAQTARPARPHGARVDPQRRPRAPISRPTAPIRCCAISSTTTCARTSAARRRSSSPPAPGRAAAPERKRTVDLGGAVKCIEAAQELGVDRFLMVSSMGTRDLEHAGPMRPYLEAKAEADTALETSGLDWTIVRPGPLTNEPGTGNVELARRWRAAGRSPATTSRSSSTTASRPRTRCARSSTCCPARCPPTSRCGRCRA